MPRRRDAVVRRGFRHIALGVREQPGFVVVDMPDNEAATAVAVVCDAVAAAYHPTTLRDGLARQLIEPWATAQAALPRRHLHLGPANDDLDLLLQDLKELGNPFPEVGITGYPESHPTISDDLTVQAIGGAGGDRQHDVAHRVPAPAAGRAARRHQAQPVVGAEGLRVQTGQLGRHGDDEERGVLVGAGREREAHTDLFSNRALSSARGSCFAVADA